MISTRGARAAERWVAARPRASARSAVSFSPASPRTPSVPKRDRAMAASMEHRPRPSPAHSPDRAGPRHPVGRRGDPRRRGAPIIAAMPTDHPPAAVLARAHGPARSGPGRRRGPAAPAPAGPLTPRDAAHVIRTIDAVCHAAPASDLPFERYAVLDELGASL